MNEKELLTHLGEKSNSPNRYDKNLLERVPRLLNRKEYGIIGDEFVGVDTWHNYEVSFLTTSGFPVSGIVKINVPSSSEYIVESKSLKLYFNSFNMEHLAETTEASIRKLVDTASVDISMLLECKIQLSFFSNECFFDTNPLLAYKNIDNPKGAELISFNSYTESPELLRKINCRTKPQQLMSHLLRSNCKVTHQPDWGSIFIYIDGEHHIDETSLLKYIVSFRNENHFHEEICEMAYIRLLELLAPKQLLVACLYTRRGGIDICPIRATSAKLIPECFSNINQFAIRTARM